MGKNSVSHSTCTKWFLRLREENFDLDNEKRPSQPRKIKGNELEQLLKENSWETQSELVETFGVTQQTISRSLNKLGLIKKEGRWVSHDSSPENKIRCRDTLMSLLPQFKQKGFFYKIVTGNEK